jgi:PAS domain S-box-containing protein
MTKKVLHILMVEDDPLDAELNKEQLLVQDEFQYNFTVVDNKADFIKSLEEDPPDLILCDYNLPQYNGLEALHDLMDRNKLIPFIFVTGTMQEEIAADAIKAGAWDYVVKDRLFRLPLAVQSVLKLRTEKEIAAEAEKKTNRLLKAIEETSAQIIVSDNEGRIQYVNKRFTEITGFTQDDVKGRDITLFSPDNEIWEQNQEVFKKLEKGEVFRGELKSVKKDGSDYWELVSITPIKDNENNITNFVAVKEDITLRKEMELDLIEARDRAERSDQLKEAFLQNMSHEIRTPLNAIVGFSGLLHEKAIENPDRIEYYTSIISNSSQQLLDIVSDILTIASIQTGAEKPEFESFDLNALFDHLYEVFQPLAQRKNLYLNYTKGIDANNLFIYSDKTKLTQILTNHLNNAIKFTHKGSIEFSYTLNGNAIEFNVTDTGIGIDKEYHELIFERFRQAKPEIHLEYGGTGLGLSISKSFAEMLGGSIQVQSALNRGSIFTLTIPFNPAKDPKETEHLETKELITGPLKILVAEDEINNFQLLESILADEQITLLHAINGREALELFRRNPDTDLVLMDIKMPVVDGIAAFEAIRKEDKNVPIIALTAFALKNDKKRLLRQGFTDYLAKPIFPADLLEKINSTVTARKDSIE